MEPLEFRVLADFNADGFITHMDRLYVVNKYNILEEYSGDCLDRASVDEVLKIGMPIVHTHNEQLADYIEDLILKYDENNIPICDRIEYLSDGFQKYFEEEILNVL